LNFGVINPKIIFITIYKILLISIVFLKKFVHVKGTKHVDPNTGIIYFKYDFGYEFGVIFEDGRKVVGGIRNGNQEESKKILSRRTSDIEVPVIHERTGRASVVSFGATTPIEFEKLDKAKKRYSLPTPNYYGNIQASGIVCVLCFVNVVTFCTSFNISLIKV
jgi:hypothetical protein